ncbi:hypothetical protein CEP10_12490 [Cylindrospermopsis raciborskii S07]|jgi:hypothetical protein|uniref:Uncharacterized protein n=4 Tax=Cylindrospermopsis raciborskii TaxID=77022 RepID=A0A853MDG6_9CYAN|nr:MULTISPECIES: hypothetical protein [Cylindrospermopsis]MBA4445005.1 hypothetical protein [Cylindrospermopsis raciborskii CS-506_C]MBA4449225.1 hypothetical protein [Cylindrospermopsis raciborskii CS-506_D]MBA4455866.1 hypothetical protein [Cylindrospermopsis raciborskii CS-506_B]MBA4465207.1 hypothetical protein [Cylindrospermopsis raciborskii CS-506_A]MBU6343704.1 hypothetical protein [Cyanobacteria bacterium REEB494]MCH4903749.1 hypothetical protein [Cylindrospermopsis raciborskii CHAB34
MAKIMINDLEPINSETFINDLNNQNSQAIFGGEDPYFDGLINFGIKTLEFMVVITAINAISFLVYSFQE